MFAPPHAHDQYALPPTAPPEAYAFVPAPNPPAIPLNGLSYLQHSQLQQSSIEHRRSISLPQTPAPGGGAPLHHPLQQPQQRYFLDDLSPSSSAAPPNIARQPMYMPDQQQMMHLPPIPRRARGERISTRDFVPPDVTGLSKREARLVKNRAAAFLSRQRKREEFEAMELRVADLEAQNAALLGQISGSMQAMPPSEAHAAHVAALNARIATLERELATLSENSRSPSPSSSQGSSLGQNSLDASSTHSQHQSQQQTVGMGLMALLSLCSMSPPTTKFAFTPSSGAGGPESEPTPVTATPFNYESIARWQERLAASSPAPPSNVGVDESVEFDIAFSQTDDNRIRCHVSVPAPTQAFLMPHQQMYSSSPPDYGNRSLPGSASAYTTTFAEASPAQWQQQPQQPAVPAAGQQLGPARRVRVALRATQLSGSGSGDWEVEVC